MMGIAPRGEPLRQTPSVLYVAVDDLISTGGNFISGFQEFAVALERAGIPAVWVSSRTRLQLDEPRRKLGHTHPFIAEDGCGVFLPEDYFHLRPQPSPRSKSEPGVTVRLGRFTCLPIAEQQPAAAETLESLASQSGMAIVPLASLSPRELAQNLGLQRPEADLARQRDFDEIFFFTGAAADKIQPFRELAESRNCQIRERGVLWSLAVGASVERCVRELSKLYDRALHSHARSVALALRGHDGDLVSACDRAVLLIDAVESSPKTKDQRGGRVMELPIRAADKWERILDFVGGHR